MGGPSPFLALQGFEPVPSWFLFFFWGRLVANYVTFVVGEILLLILTLCSLAAIFPRVRRLKGGG